MNKKIFVPIFALVLLLPTIVIILITLTNTPKTNIEEFKEGEGVLRVTDDKKYFFSAESKENSYLFDLFFSLEERSTKSELTPEDISSEHKYTVEFKDKESVKSLTFVPSLSEPCLWYNEDNEVYTLSKNDSDRFINSEYAWTLYQYAKAPTLTSATSQKIYPKQTTWTYASQNGSFIKGITDETTESLVTYFAQLVSIFSFDIQPDRCTVRAYADSVKIYDGPLDGLEKSDILNHTSARLEVEATWVRSHGCKYFGSAQYEFIIKRFQLAEISIDSAEVEAGSFMLAKVTNVDNVKNIRVSSSKPLNFSPGFFKRGDTAFAIIPFKTDLEPGVYTLTVNYGISSQSFDITLLPKEQKTKSSSLSPSSTLSQKNLEALNKLIKDIGSDHSEQIYISDGFYNYEENGFTVYLGFNNIWNYADGSSFTQIGVDFWSAYGENVPAFNAGLVCNVGEDPILGKYVVVDHGYGIKSWYAHLSAITVSVGDTVKKGDIIARTGKSGIADSSGFYLITTVLGTPVSPYKLYENDFVIK